MRIDLHTHSTVSDGTDSPTELVEPAARGRTRRGGADRSRHVRRSGRGRGRRVERPGVGSSAGWSCPAPGSDQSVHLLAYGADPEHPGLAAEMARVRGGRTGRLRPVLDKLAELGVPVSEEEVLAQVGSQPVGGSPAHRRRDGRRRSRPGPYGGLRPLPGRRRPGARAAVRDRDRPRHRPGARRGRGGGDRPSLGPRPGARCCRRRSCEQLVAEHGLDGIEVDHQDHDADDPGRLRPWPTGWAC